jgi:hypothetical protein
LVKRHELGHGLLDEFGRVVHGDVRRAHDDVQALVAAPGAPECILAESQRSGPAAGDEPEGLRQKLFRQMKGDVCDQPSQAVHRNDARHVSFSDR